MLTILFQDQDLLAIHKPAGLLVHKSSVAMDVDVNVVDLLQEQLGFPVFPIHRIDRPTSGVLLFALNTAMAKQLSGLLQQNEVKKWYLAILRGKTAASGHITKSLSSEYNSTKKTAISFYVTLGNYLANIPYRGYPTTPYSVVLASPQTGRTHQLRQHFAHIRHYIIGDKKHGDVKQNKHITSKMQEQTMYLHAYQLNFFHPITRKEIVITAPIPPSWNKMKALLMIDLEKLAQQHALSNHPIYISPDITENQESTHYIYG